ncbi:hypothetical protein HY468_02165 [Candidatus Roizmanbacteria bacterium]|nr:hypothetical protein [Candidatus Roizmanbacteria bacterium]
MIVERQSPQAENPVKQIQLRAVTALTRYLESPEERTLAEQDTRVVQSLRESLVEGYTAGYISLPRGTNTAVVIDGLVRALGVQNITVVSWDAEAETVRCQTYNPDTDLSEEVEFLIYEQIDSLRGAEHRSFLHQFPHALTVGLTTKPEVRPPQGLDEQYVDIFENQIYEMSSDEAVARGALPAQKEDEKITEKHKTELSQKLHGAPIEKMDDVLSETVTTIYDENPGLTTLELFTHLAERLPFFIRKPVQQKVLDAIASPDRAISNAGKQVIMLLYCKTVLSALEPLLTDNEEDTNELVQSAMQSVYDHAQNFHLQFELSVQIRRVARNKIVQDVADRETIPSLWVENGKHKEIIAAVDQALVSYRELSFERRRDLAKDISGKTGMNGDTIREYIDFRNDLVTIENATPQDPIERSDNTMIQSTLKTHLHFALAGIYSNFQRAETHERAVDIIVRRYGLAGYDPATFRELAEKYSISIQAIRKEEARVLSYLHHPRFARKLRPFIDPGRGIGLNHQSFQKEIDRSHITVTAHSPIAALAAVPQHVRDKLQDAQISSLGQMTDQPIDALIEKAALIPQEIEDLRKAIITILSTYYCEELRYQLYSQYLTIAQKARALGVMLPS